MITTLLGFSWFNWFRKSLVAQIVMGLVALGGVWQLNNHYVAKGAVAKVVKASETQGKKRNAKVRKIRRSIKPGSAMQRLRREYAGADKR